MPSRGSFAPLVVLVALACPQGDDAARKPAASAPASARGSAPAGSVEGGAPPVTGGAPGGAPDGAKGGSAWTWALPVGLTVPPEVPPDNPMSAAKVELGHALFMDKRLSGDGSRSCYSCHQNELGNADGRAKALGAGDKPLSRNTPTIWNVGYHRALYWDGRAASLEKQGLGALAGGNMGVGEDKMAAKAAEIAALPEYAEAFRAVFGLDAAQPVTMDHVAAALSAYQRTLLCGDTTFDRGELDDAARRGWDLFRGKASCTTCHGGESFTDGLFHAVGVGFAADGSALGEPDPGRGKPAQDPAQDHKFRTPTLRNVARTAPYFHDGSVATLEEAVAFMARGGVPKAPNFDPNLRDVGLTDAEIADLVAFLRTLDCPGRLEVVGDQKVAGIPG
jgi:cytochrome c peroxidase